MYKKDCDFRKNPLDLTESNCRNLTFTSHNFLHFLKVFCLNHSQWKQIRRSHVFCWKTDLEIMHNCNLSFIMRCLGSGCFGLP